MTSRISARRLPLLGVGVIGHVHDGKTALTAALTQVTEGERRTRASLLDNLDRVRDLTTLGKCIEYATERHRVIHWDCPGHADYGKNTIRCLSQVDAVILVISATAGPREQSREHLVYARAFGVEHVIVFLNKCELVDEPELLDMVELETRELLCACGFDGDTTPVIRGSAEQACRGEELEPLYALRDAIDAVPSPVRASSGPLVMPIVRSYSRWYRLRHGCAPVESTVVAGRIERGRLSKLDELEVVGHGQVHRGRALLLRSFDRIVARLEAGESCGCQLGETPPWEITCGMVLAAAGSWTTHRQFVARLTLSPRPRPREKGTPMPSAGFRSGYRPQLYVRAADIPCTLRLTESRRAEPGEVVSAVVELDVPTVLAGAPGFILRNGGWTVATGTIVELMDGS